MEKLDFWLFQGFGGLINMMNQRIDLPIAINKEVAAKLSRYATDLIVLKTHAAEKVKQVTPGKPPSVDSVDCWIWRGLNGIVNILEKRVELEEPLDRRNLQALKDELHRLTKIVGALDGSSTISSTPTDVRS